MKDRRDLHVQRLLFDVDWAIQNELGPRDLVPMLEKLIRCAVPGSDAALFGKRQLAETLLQSAPWRAALLLRDVLSHGDDDRAWAVLGLCHTLLGHYRCAARAYARALALTPENPWYAHNLGHVLDVALEQPQQALRHLRFAYRELKGDTEVASSYAHALAHAGRISDAERVLSRALRDADRARKVLDTWLADEGSAAAGGHPAATPGGQRRAAPVRTRKKRALTL
ncbi:MAG TPA: tetratricopeptide repeat protein [Polyangiaceae bacterium]|nr:tetratricopeptide repeat protein [Polyangiaceae bacterium]